MIYEVGRNRRISWNVIYLENNEADVTPKGRVSR